MNLWNNDNLGVPQPSPIFSVSPNHRRLHNNISDKSACYEEPNEENAKTSIIPVMGGSVSVAFYPQEFILRILGRFPFDIGNQPSFSKRFYFFQIFSWMYFLTTTAILLFLLVMTTLGFSCHYLAWNFITNSNYRIQERKLFNANLVPFVLFWGCLLHGTVGSISFVVNRKFIVKYFETWNELVYLLGVPLRNTIRRFLILSNLIMLGFFLILNLFYFTNFIPIVRGTALLIMLLIRRPFYPNDIDLISGRDSPMVITGIGFAIILYVVYASRALMFFFTFKCRLIRVCFDDWNQRLRTQLKFDPKCKNRDGGVLNEEEKGICTKLFRDHCRIVKMMRKTDSVFAAALQSYYLTQIMNMCFELYYLARTDCFTKQRGDIIAALLLIPQTFLLFFTVSLEGARVNDSAMEGFQILRSRGIQLMDSREKKYLIQNLLVNYSQNIVLTGGKFFSLDRPFIIRVLGAVFTYFVIILQFGSRLTGDCTLEA